MDTYIYKMSRQRKRHKQKQSKTDSYKSGVVFLYRNATIREQ